MKFSESRSVFNFVCCEKLLLQMTCTSFFDMSNSSSSACSWRFGKSLNLLRAKLITTTRNGESVRINQFNAIANNKTSK
jgi:hypothetical protein